VREVFSGEKMSGVAREEEGAARGEGAASPSLSSATQRQVERLRKEGGGGERDAWRARGW